MKKNVRQRQKQGGGGRLESDLSGSNSLRQLPGQSPQQPTSAQKQPATQPIEFVSPLEKSRTNISILESPVFSPSPMKRAGMGGLTPSSNGVFISPFEQSRASAMSSSDVYRATRGSGSIFTPSRGSVVIGTGISPLTRGNMPMSVGAKVTGGLNKTVAGGNLLRVQQQIQERQEQRAPFQLDDRTLELCRGILQDEQTMLAQAKEELVFLRESLFDVEITKH